MQNKNIEQSFVNQSSANAKQSANYLKQLYRRSSLFRWRLKPTFQTDINRFIPPSDPWRGSATIGRDVLHSAMPVKETNPNILHLNGFAMFEIMAAIKQEFMYEMKYLYGYQKIPTGTQKYGTRNF